MNSCVRLFAILFVLLSTFVCRSFSQYHVASLDSGLIAYYPFNGNANDESGNGNDGTVHGAVLDKDRFLRDSSAYHFADSSYVSIPELFQAGQASFTISAWESTQELSGVDQALYYKGSIEGELGFGITDTVFNFGVKLSDDQWYKLRATTVHLLNRYYHVLARYQRGSTIDLWIDGLLIDTKNIPNLALKVTAPFTYSSIGAVYGGSQNFWRGIIDDMRIYNRALSDAEIVALYSHELTYAEDVRTSLPTEFHLEQNYPNPFNPSTSISYEVAKSSRVTITISNILGQEVATPVGERQQSGKHTFSWIAEGLTSGVYFYRMVAGGIVETKKMILMK